jgi:hypothetical protein
MHRIMETLGEQEAREESENGIEEQQQAQLLKAGVSESPTQTFFDPEDAQGTGPRRWRQPILPQDDADATTTPVEGVTPSAVLEGKQPQGTTSSPGAASPEASGPARRLRDTSAPAPRMQSVRMQGVYLGAVELKAG